MTFLTLEMYCVIVNKLSSLKLIHNHSHLLTMSSCKQQHLSQGFWALSAHPLSRQRFYLPEVAELEPSFIGCIYTTL